jgi:hypothetical protein
MGLFDFPDSSYRGRKNTENVQLFYIIITFYFYKTHKWNLLVRHPLSPHVNDSHQERVSQKV